MIDFQSRANFDLVRKYYGEAGDAMMGSLGNHDFYAYLEAQPLLKAVLAGHIHVTVADRFSPTAIEYVIGGNFLFHGQEISVS